MSNVFTMILVGLMGLIGGLSSIYLLVSIPAIIIWKIYRKIRYGYSMYD